EIAWGDSMIGVSVLVEEVAEDCPVAVTTMTASASVGVDWASRAAGAMAVLAASVQAAGNFLFLLSHKRSGERANARHWQLQVTGRRNVRFFHSKQGARFENLGIAGRDLPHAGPPETQIPEITLWGARVGYGRLSDASRRPKR